MALEGEPELPGPDVEHLKEETGSNPNLNERLALPAGYEASICQRPCHVEYMNFRSDAEAEENCVKTIL